MTEKPIRDPRGHRAGRRSLKTNADAAAREQRGEKVAALYITGLSIRAIALQLGINKTTAAEDLAAIRERWRKNAEADWLERVTVVEAELDEARRQAWAAWKASQGTQKVRTSKKKPSGPEVEVKSSVSYGDASYLEKILKGLDQKARLLGLNAPSKVEATLKNADGLPPTREQMRDEVLAALARMSEVQKRASKN